VVRTQIQLTEKQWKTLKALSHQQGVSVAELIRQSVDDYTRKAQPKHLDADEKRSRIMAVVGRHRSGLSDVSINHDRYLAEDYMA